MMFLRLELSLNVSGCKGKNVPVKRGSKSVKKGIKTAYLSVFIPFFDKYWEIWVENE